MGYVSGVPLLGAVAISAKKMYPGPDDRTEYKKRYIHLGSYTYPSVREYISRFLRLSSPSPARVSSLDLAVLVLLCSGAGALFHFLPPVPRRAPRLQRQGGGGLTGEKPLRFLPFQSYLFLCLKRMASSSS